MKNYFVLNQDLTKIQAIDALATILQDESLQLTGEMEKVGLSAWKRCFLVRDYENGNTYGYNDSDGYHFENLEQVLDNFEDFHQSCFLDDLDCCQLAANIDGICYVAVDDEQEDEINIDIDCL